MLKQSEAINIINQAIEKGYRIYIPRDSELVQDKRFQVKEVKKDLTVLTLYGILVIANDYRLESMYAQACHSLGSR